MKNILLIILALYGVAAETDNVEPSISGGSLAAAGQFPYQVAIGFNIPNVGGSFCGGALIRNRWILTAATCVSEPRTDITVILGTLNLLGNIHWRSNAVPRSNIHIHPNFNAVRNTRNIALVYVPDMWENATAHANVGTVNLPDYNEASQNVVSRMAIISGYGMTNHSFGDGQLRYVSTAIVPNLVCASLPLYNLTDSNLCINTMGGRSTCPGDDGGPLTIEVSGNRRILAGIASLTLDMCDAGLPAIFESVLFHREWIENTINGSEIIKINFFVLIAVLGVAVKNFM